MGRFYKTARPLFVDNNIYNPNLDLMSQLADAEVEADALKNSFSAMAEYDLVDTFDPWKKDVYNEVSNLNENVKDIVRDLIADPNSIDATKKLDEVTSYAKELYSLGRVGQMARHFSEYQDYMQSSIKEIENTKDDEKRAFKQDRLNDYEEYIKSTLGDSYQEGWSRRDLNSYFDAQDYLKEKINVDKMKQSYSYIGKPVKLIKKDNALVPITSVKGKYNKDTKQFVDDKGISYDVLEGVDDQLKAFKLLYQWYRDDVSIEGYDQDKIREIATQMLRNNAFEGMLLDDYEIFGQGRKDESKNDFIERNILEQADMFASQYPEVTKRKENRTVYKDNFRMQAALTNRQNRYNRQPPLTAAPNKGIEWWVNYTPEGKEKTRKYNKIKEELLKRNMSPKQLEKYINGDNSILDKVEAAIFSVGGESMKALESLNEQYRHLNTAGYNQFYQQISNNPKNLKKIQDEFQSTRLETAMKDATGYFKFQNVDGNDYLNKGFKEGKKVSPGYFLNKRLKDVVDVVGDTFIDQSTIDTYGDLVITSVKPIEGTGFPKNITGNNLTDGATLDYKFELSNKKVGKKKSEKIPFTIQATMVSEDVDFSVTLER